MALITNTDSSILPYNDDYMVYDLDRQMYLLTDEGVRLLTGEYLEQLAGDKTKAELIRYEVSQDIYNYIAMYSLNYTYKYKVFTIAKNEDFRELFKRILADQTRYYIRSGAGLLKDMHGVHIEKGKALSLNSIRNQVLVSQSVETQLGRTGLLFTGRLSEPTGYTDDGSW